MRRFWPLATVLFLAACGGRGTPCPRSTLQAEAADDNAAKSSAGGAPQQTCTVQR